MALSVSQFMLLCCFFSLYLGSIHSLHSPRPLCHHDERTYLLEFMKSFNRSWEPVGQNSDCCRWNGIECDKVSGYVVTLNITNMGRLNGPLDSNNSLFRLVHLRSLVLSESNFSYSKIPDSITNLSSLETLDMSKCNFSGSIPSFLGNLAQLSHLDISFNAFRTQGFSSLSWIAHMTKLKDLLLDSTNLVGTIPPFIMNMTQLESLSISFNHLQGMVDMSAFNRFRNLQHLGLSFSNLSLLVETPHTLNLSTLRWLWLASCNLSSFPSFLCNTRSLLVLDLSSNKISGEVPKCLMTIGTNSLFHLNLSRNSLTGFKEKPQLSLPWTQLEVLDLSYNNLQGPIPIPSPTAPLWMYSVSRNNLSGPISPMVCNMNVSSLEYLDLSINKLNGQIPLCMKRLMDQPVVMKLNNNSFVGQIPEFREKNCYLWGIDFSFNKLEGTLPKSITNCQGLRFISLRNNHITGSLPSSFGSLSLLAMLDLSHNQLQGKLPRSLLKCTQLEYLSLGNNQFNDSFPSWLGYLSRLRVLSLKSNRFQGKVRIHKRNLLFQMLQVLDISSNNFIGDMPSELFKHLKAMEVPVKSPEAYMITKFFPYYTYSTNFRLISKQCSDFSLRVDNKGNSLDYWKVPNALVVLDLSSNNFTGQIPESLGNLQGLMVLNFSSNVLMGRIPSSLGNLTVIEALDLSQNMLSGEIPQELAKLDKLGFFNLSENQLTGPLPKGRHLDTFNNDSYIGNEGLCGKPLSKICVTDDLSPSASQDLDSTTEIDWKLIMIGYGTGIIIGISIGYMFTTWKHQWFVRFVRKKRQFKRRQIRTSTN